MVLERRPGAPSAAHGSKLSGPRYELPPRYYIEPLVTSCSKALHRPSYRRQSSFSSQRVELCPKMRRELRSGQLIVEGHLGHAAGAGSSRLGPDVAQGDVGDIECMLLAAELSLHLFRCCPAWLQSSSRRLAASVSFVAALAHSLGATAI